MKTAIAYIRLSPKPRDKYAHVATYYGDDAQLAECQAWAAAHDVQILGVHRDIDVSGAAPLSERPGLTDAIEDVRTQEADFLLVGKRDRLARDTLNALIIERDLAKVGARVVQANGSNEDTAEAKMIRTILDAVAEYEREIGRARTKAALAALKARGVKLGRPRREPTPSESGYDWHAVTAARAPARAKRKHRQDRRRAATARAARQANEWAASIVPGRTS